MSGYSRRSPTGREPAVVHKKLTLPSKTCPVCGRPFVWRKKWARDWENVRYCSERWRRPGAGPP
ncbi:DUF2256 domain-containing protein, partial [Nakamurella flava]|uniref:DUF2256 domain-containing protein n=1 Tax=Nakamurella flava TaxID=2576308 RepID=UPI003B846D25